MALVNDDMFFCTKCGKRGFSVPRKKGKDREAGHLKKLWCIYCKEERNFVDCRPWTKYDAQNFKEEFYGGNFTEDGLRKEEYGTFKDKLVKNKKWNELLDRIEEMEENE